MNGNLEYSIFEDAEIERKGYVCPSNIYNRLEEWNRSAAETCPNCIHWQKDCIVYGKKRKKHRNNR